jgi:hypothetical protein
MWEDLYIKIVVKLRWHACILREFKLMTLSRFYLYNYIGLGEIACSKKHCMS